MKPPLFFILLGSAFLLVAALASCGISPGLPPATGTPPLAPGFTPTSAPSGGSIRGVVVDSAGRPVAGATVRLQATALSTVADAEGRFTLTGMQPGRAVRLTAWASGYYNGGGKDDILPGATDVKIVLPAHAGADAPGYAWLSAFSSAGYAGSGENGNCQNCHADPVDPTSDLPFDEWSRDAHAGAARNPRFLSMFLGTDLAGDQSPLTRYGLDRDYGRIPLRPDPSQPYYGPGYKLDFPDTNGNCAACHAPAAGVNAPYGTDPAGATAVGAEGVTCDFCHKVWGVHLDQSTGLPSLNMPGVLSFEFRRPPAGHQFFAGPFDDVAPFEDTYSPIQRQSQFCAPCHFGAFWDTQIYNSFGEWLASPYSEASTGKTCQDCHMPSGKADVFARPDKGGLERDPATIVSHLMPGASSADLLGNAVSMRVSAVREKGSLIVAVTLTNDKAGHDVPTDSPLRQMILLVSAVDAQGRALAFLDGPRVPEWGGVGDPAGGDYAGLPGEGFAKILAELWTDVSPTGAYWNPTRIASDNRLAPFQSDVSRYTFALPAEGEAVVRISLLYRRAFKELMDQKGWDVPDIVMGQETIPIGK